MCIEGATFEKPRGGVRSLRVQTLADIGGRYILILITQLRSCKRGGIPVEGWISGHWEKVQGVEATTRLSPVSSTPVHSESNSILLETPDLEVQQVLDGLHACRDNHPATPS